MILDLLKANASAAKVKDKADFLPIPLAVTAEYSSEFIIALFLGTNDASFPHYEANLHNKLMSLDTAKGNKKLLSTKNQSGSLLLRAAISHGYSLG